MNKVKIENHVATAHSDVVLEKIKMVSIGKKLSQTKKTFGSTYRRLSLDLPSPTITRSGYRDFIHPNENRMLTVRELARLQSFPDTWVFKGVRLDSYSSKRKTSITQFGQVGNAVPPEIARILAEEIKNQLL
jgi:site-specific DNA-cytosine methylase